MIKHACLPTTHTLDEGSDFVSHIIEGVAGVFGITLKHATTKQTETIGLLEQSHASIEQALKIEKGERKL